MPNKIAGCTKEYIQELMEILENGHPMDCAEAVVKLGQFGRKSIPAIPYINRALVKHFDCYPLCYHTLTTVEKIGIRNQEVAKILLQLFGHTKERIRQYTQELCIQLGLFDDEKNDTEKLLFQEVIKRKFKIK